MTSLVSTVRLVAVSSAALFCQCALAFQLIQYPSFPGSERECADVNSENSRNVLAESNQLTQNADRVLRLGSPPWHAEYQRIGKWQNQMFDIMQQQVYACYDRRRQIKAREEQQERERVARQNEERQQRSTQAARQYERARTVYQQAETATNAARAEAAARGGAAEYLTKKAIAEANAEAARQVMESLRPPRNSYQDERVNAVNDAARDVVGHVQQSKVIGAIQDNLLGEIKSQQNQMFGDLDRTMRDTQQFQNQSTQRPFTPQSLNVAINAELNKSSPDAARQMALNSAIDAELNRSAPSVAQQANLNSAIEAEMAKSSPDVSRQIQLNAAIDAELSRSVPESAQQLRQTAALALEDGSTYSGATLSGRAHGYGTLTTRGGIRREGTFENGVFISGFVTYPNGTRVEWRNGKPVK